MDALSFLGAGAIGVIPILAVCLRCRVVLEVTPRGIKMQITPDQKETRAAKDSSAASKRLGHPP